MQANIGIGDVPVPAGLMIAIDHHDLRVGFRHQHVGERHAHGAAADHHIVRLQHAQSPTMA